ncbi:hypothetical protein [Deinococcus petrolearius]|uniref:Type 4 fimbrial biogenesis protein PilX N-terminal domain-containing protein n=1 Tax=Deinococcus petrolearius TaxID=1751295 RepID=A0ABW1DN73_9DEIO
MIIVVLFTSIILAVVVATTSVLTLGGRRNSADEAAAYQAVLASESGQQAFVVRSRTLTPFSNWDLTCSGTPKQKALCSINKWLETENNAKRVGTFAVSNSGAVVLRATDVEIREAPAGSGKYKLVSVDIQATGTARSSEARALQRYTAIKQDLPNLDLPAAVTSHPDVRLSGGAIVDGVTTNSAGNDAVYQRLLSVRRTGETSLSMGTQVTVDVNTASLDRLAQVKVGSYVRLPINSLAGTLSGTHEGTFRVDASVGGRLTLQPIRLPSLPGGAIPYLESGNIDLDYVMNGVVSLAGNTLTVQATETFIKGDTVAVTVGNTTYTTTVTEPPVAGAAGTVLKVGTWSPGTPPTSSSEPLEGQALRKSTRGVVTAGEFDEGRAAPVGGILEGAAGQALVPSPLQDALFKKTFGMTPTELKAMSQVITASQFADMAGQIDGLMWMTNVGNGNLNNEKPTGKGILVIDGDFTLNQNGDEQCDLSGLIYVRGNLRIQGNLQMCGALVVEGSILNSEGIVVGEDDDDSFFSGNGRKITYSADALFDVVAGAGAYQFSRQAGTWRQK